MRSLIWILPLLALSFAAAADDKAEIQELYAAVSALNQEQQSLYQQFQMLQEVRRTNDREFFNSQVRPPQLTTEIPKYDEVGDAQREVVRRAEELTRQSDQLYAQYNELGARKALLQQRILELTTPK
jgi:phage host-nuclease inhibitor protein Gam